MPVMLTLIFTILFGIGFAFFATQNISTTTISLGPYIFAGVPLYLVALLSLFVGILLSAIISGLNSFAAYLSLRGKDVKIHQTEKEVDRLQDKIKLLEMENAKLKGEPVNKRVELTDSNKDEARMPNIFTKFRHHLP